MGGISTYWAVYRRFFSEKSFLILFKSGLAKPVDFTGVTYVLCFFTQNGLVILGWN